MNEGQLDGKLFSRTYLNKGEPTSDSIRFRRRIAAVLWDLELKRDIFDWINKSTDRYGRKHSMEDISLVLRRRLGVKLPPAIGGVDWNAYAEKSELRDILDTITILADYGRKEWIKYAEIIFREENLSYTMDKDGGVHFFVDADFEATRFSAISAIRSRRYDNVRAEFERGYIALDSTPPDGKSAIRSNFAAVEGLFRLICTRSERLSGKFIEEQLASRLKDIFIGQTK